MDSFEAIVQHAVDLEQNSYEFYQNMAKQAERPEIAKVFTEMAAQEMGHKKSWRLCSRGMANPVTNDLHRMMI